MTGPSLPLSSPPLPSPHGACVDSASAPQGPTTGSKSEIKSPHPKKSGSQDEMQPPQVNNKQSGAAAGPAAVHGVTGCEVRTTHRSQESMSHFAKAAQTWCQNPTVFLSAASRTGGGDGGAGGEGRIKRKKERKKRVLYFQTMSQKRLQASFATSLPSKIKQRSVLVFTCSGALPRFHSSARCRVCAHRSAQMHRRVFSCSPLPPTPREEKKKDNTEKNQLLSSA